MVNIIVNRTEHIRNQSTTQSLAFTIYISIATSRKIDALE